MSFFLGSLYKNHLFPFHMKFNETLKILIRVSKFNFKIRDLDPFNLVLVNFLNSPKTLTRIDNEEC